MGRIVAFFCLTALLASAAADPAAKVSSRGNQHDEHEGGDLLPPADQWNNLQKEAEQSRTETKANLDHEGSGDDDDDDDYYWDDDDDYYDLGSGDGLWKWNDLKKEKTNANEEAVEAAPAAPADDIHFAEDKHHHNSQSPSCNHDDALYEYYNELYDQHDYEEDGIDLDSSDEDDDDDDEDSDEYDDDDDDADYESAAPTVGSSDREEADEQPKAAPTPVFRLSYLYVVLVSGLVSFVVALGLFFLCRRSALAREKKRKGGGPFVVSDHRVAAAAAAQPTPIVKSYQRVPTSAREYLEPPPPPRYHASVDMTSQKPLLT
jgi:hypothetical protein